MGVTIHHGVISDVFFVLDKTRLSRFVHLWLLAIDKQDPTYTPYPEDDNEATRELAERRNWIVQGKPGQYELTGPDRKVLWLRNDQQQTSTYVIEAVGTGTVKIGKSTNVGARMATLQTSTPSELRLVAVLKGDIENNLHRRFAAHRLNGEWFRFDDEIKSAIESIEKAGR
jgi:hypothetical protein